MNELDQLHKDHSIAIIQFEMAQARLNTIKSKLAEELNKQNGNQPNKITAKAKKIGG